MTTWIAAATRSSNTFSQIWPILVILVGIVIVGFVVIALVRRWMNSGNTNGPIGFTLSDLRKLHAEGKLSSEELERAEQQMIKRVRSTASEAEAIRIRPRGKSDSAGTTQESSPEDTE